jgi:excisionase family DNA binding protein
MTIQHDDSIDARRYFGIAAAANYVDVSTSTVRRWLADRKLTAYRPTRRVLIDRRELETLIRQQQAGPDAGEPAVAASKEKEGP